MVITAHDIFAVCWEMVTALSLSACMTYRKLNALLDQIQNCLLVGAVRIRSGSLT